MGAHDRNRRPRRTVRAAGVERAVAQTRRAVRGMPRINVSGLSPLLHYRDATPRHGVGSDHREPSPLFRGRRGAPDGGCRAGRGHSAGGRSRDLRRGARTRRGGIAVLRALAFKCALRGFCARCRCATARQGRLYAGSLAHAATARAGAALFCGAAARRRWPPSLQQSRGVPRILRRSL